MKIYFIFLITVSLFMTVYGTGCAKKVGADANLVTRVKAGDYDFEDAKMKEFFYCMFTEMGFLNDKGEIFKDVILSTTTKDNRNLVQTALDACDGTTGKDLKEMSWNYAKCYSKGYPEDVFIDE